MSRTIGVLTSGGDAPGMNAAIRSVVRSALARGFRVIGIRRGYQGLIEGDMFEMCARDVSDIMQRGGTVLYTARSPEFETPAGVAKAKANCDAVGIDSLVVIGGDGTYRGALELFRLGVKIIGIPGT
ncbi:MAG: 6-phosphofructokinase, partial [Oscillospiraceae bacterium]|nr:6-phosphofructokinase [Oscillospiraceae bacterium]